MQKHRAENVYMHTDVYIASEADAALVAKDARIAEIEKECGDRVEDLKQYDVLELRRKRRVLNMRNRVFETALMVALTPLDTWRDVERHEDFVKRERGLEVGWWHLHGIAKDMRVPCDWVGDQIKCPLCNMERTTARRGDKQ